ncbi:MAG TPA: hypothetical protein VLG50_08010 [Candidatus Saccharimonadales bacterium]|nr:hypothetical protein [Candidatus Saccharimonadales bacterium]
MNIDRIIKNEKQEKMDHIKKDEEVARQLSRQHVDERVLSDSLEQQEINDYDIMSKIIEDSYYTAQQEEEYRILSAISESEALEKERISKETVYETITRLCHNQPSIVIKLK